MLAGVRSRFLLFFWLSVLIGACLPGQAQINGVPASVTSFGFGGNMNPTLGIRASVTSLGPNGYGNSQPIFGSCCAGYFLPANPHPPLFSGHHRRHDSDRGYFPVGLFEPAYIPYAVPYPVEVVETDDESLDVYSVRAPGPRKPAPPNKRAEDPESTPRADVATKPAPPDPEVEVAAQPSTVLVFKDGHHSDVLNYAIVGDTLFDLGAGHAKKILLADLDLTATRKANDDRGVDFQIPTSTNRQ
jgi:hypothetical protein